MRIPSGKVDQSIYFVALDATDHVTRETGLATWTVYRSRSGAAEVAYTTPTITEIDGTNMPGVYALLVDEDTTIAAGSDSEEYCVHVTHAGMAPVTRTIELYRRDTTSGRTLDVSAGGEAGIDWANIGSPTTAVNLSATNIDVDQVVASVSGAVGSISAGGIDAASFGANAITAAKLDPDVTTELQAGLATAASITAIDGKVDIITGTTDAILLDTTDILADTDELQTDWVNGGRLDLILDARASQASVDDLPTNAELATALGTADDAILAQVAFVKTVTDKLDDTLEDFSGLYRFTALALEEAPSGGGSAPTAAEVADAVWDEDATAHQTQGTFGQAIGDPGADADTIWALVNINLNATVDSRATQASVDDLPTSAELATALGTADDAVLVQVALVKSQTDKLTFDGDNHVVADTRKLSTSATAAGNLEAGAIALVLGTCAAGSTTTSIVTNLAESTNDHFNGRVISFTTGALLGQSTNITDYNGGTKVLTVTALTEAAAENDQFVIS